LDILYPFIPSKVKKIWQEGLDTKSFYMKLCGAGGGGFFLIYSEARPILTDIYPLKNF
jgi:mevalonate kinase